MLSTPQLRSMTGETITSPIDLKQQLADISATGLASEQDEAVIGESALAGPVFDASGTPVGAIGLVIPSSNWPADPTSRDATREAARAISRELGATTWPNRT
jgi:DNA-binding IclR family transcriptional regulator